MTYVRRLCIFQARISEAYTVPTNADQVVRLISKGNIRWGWGLLPMFEMSEMATILRSATENLTLLRLVSLARRISSRPIIAERDSGGVQDRHMASS